MSNSCKWTRRLVLQRGLQLGAMGVATPLAINLAAIGEAAAFDTTDYKALVCIFLYGGNDYANTVVPYDPANYALYHQIRAGAGGEAAAGIALARADLAATALTPVGGAGAHRQSAIRAGAAARRPQDAVRCAAGWRCSSTSAR